MLLPDASALTALRRPALGRPLVWLLVLALCLTSTLGLMHRVLHLPAAVQGAWSATAAVDRQARPAVHTAGASAARMYGAARHGLMALFAGHGDGDLQCRLYDQLAHGSALPSVAMPMLPVVLPMAVFDFMQGEALARWVLLFDARGPPASR